jgi:hypothetical protein
MEQYKCGICLEILNNPHQCKNGHCACFNCLKTSLKISENCPTCKIPLNTNTMSRNLMLNQLINGLDLKCNGSDPNSDLKCTWKGKLQDRNKHITECSFFCDVECPFYRNGTCIVGCDGQTTRAAFTAHIEEFFDKFTSNCFVKTEMIDSVRSGKYPFKSLRQFIYTGEMDDDMRHGHGVLVSPDGTSKYEGLWFNNKRHGRGVQTYPDWKYDGEWLEDKMHGFCEARTCGLDTFVGYFANNKRHGHGTLSYGAYSYNGDWDVNQRCGKGEEKDEKGVFKGMFLKWPCQTTRQFKSVDGLCEGPIRSYSHDCFGIWVRSDGTTYNGSFLRDSPHGMGILTLPDGSVYNGWFVDGVKHGDEGESHSVNGDKYSGSFRNGMFHGEGVLHRSDGSMYIGMFERGEFHGTGRLEVPVFPTFLGNFCEGRKHGPGVFLHSGKRKFETKFDKDIQVVE